MKRIQNTIDEKVYNWMLREHPEEKSFGLPFSKTVTFKDVVERMEAGEDFGKIITYEDSSQRCKIFAQLATLTDTDYDYWFDLWLKNGDD